MVTVNFLFSQRISSSRNRFARVDFIRQVGFDPHVFVWSYVPIYIYIYIHTRVSIDIYLYMYVQTLTHMYFRNTTSLISNLPFDALLVLQC